jgi:hypothetical protein
MSYLNYSTQAPYEGQNTFYVGSSVNQLFLLLLNPMHNFYNTKVSVTVEQPIFETYKQSYEEMLKKADEATYFDVNTFVQTGYGVPFEDLINDKDSIFYPAFLGLVYEAKNYIKYEYINDKIKWRKLASLYIAHYLEIMLTLAKDVENRRSLNEALTEVKEEVDVDDKAIAKTQKQLIKNMYYQTPYGAMFWQEYSATMKYVNPLWGVIL